MNRQLLALLIGIGVTAAAAQAGAAARGAPADPVQDPEPALPQLGPGDVNGDGTIDPREAQMRINALEELLWFRIDANGNGSLDEYVDPPTDAWHQRVSLNRVA